MQSLLTSQLSSLNSELSSYVTNGVINESSLASDNRTLLEKLRTWHRFSEKLQYGMPLVSVEMLNWMADNDNLTITFKDMAKQVASITEWQQERIVFSNGFPVWTGKYTAPSDGKKTVKSMDLVSALARPIGKTAKETAKSLTVGNENFWVPYAAGMIRDQMMRNSSELKSASDASGVFKGILPKITGTDNVSNYISFMKGVPISMHQRHCFR